MTGMLQKVLIAAVGLCLVGFPGEAAPCAQRGVYLEPLSGHVLIANWSKGVTSEGRLRKSLDEQFAEIAQLPQSWFDCGNERLLCIQSSIPYRIFAVERGDVGHAFQVANVEFRISEKVSLGSGSEIETLYLVKQMPTPSHDEMSFWVSSVRGVIWARAETYGKVTSQMILASGAGFLSPNACRPPG